MPSAPDKYARGNAEHVIELAYQVLDLHDD